jgi:hypothetical protein
MYHLDNNGLIGATLNAVMQYDEKNYICININTGQINILIIKSKNDKICLRDRIFCSKYVCVTTKNINLLLLLQW